VTTERCTSIFALDLAALFPGVKRITISAGWLTPLELQHGEEAKQRLAEQLVEQYGNTGFRKVMESNGLCFCFEKPRLRTVESRSTAWRHRD